ncbi:hypothetical protein RJT34_31545 [Clitoria ternatea]|uniref:Scarecrow-like protein 3 n=1 Tax=Clitoria ternatea TaxID=43366 RepID=A0AAN9EV83_CLITE
MNLLESEGLRLVHLLKDCAKLTELGNFMDADIALYHLSRLASPNGDSMQRVATYFTEALACYHMVKNLCGVSKVLSLSKKLSTLEQQLVKQLFFDFYPFLKIAYLITNQAIFEAMLGDTIINILDLSACDATQWISLMQGLKELLLPNTPHPKIIVTAIHEKKQVLDQMELHLRLEAERLNFPFHFNPVVSTLENLDPETLPIKKGEPLAITCVLQLHSLLATDDVIEMVKIKGQRDFAEMLGKQKKKKKKMMDLDPSPVSALSPFSPCPSHRMECLLNGLWKLQPKVMVITEQESSINGCTLTERVDRALNFYGALFDCLESSISKTMVGRSLMEKMLLGEQIKNIIACEGVERKERHEKLETWIPRLELAGFWMVPISSNGIMLATKLLQSYVHGYNILEDKKSLFICWKEIPLFSVSAWSS